MSTSIKKFIIQKKSGNITSLIYGMVFIFLMLVWCLFSYRLTILNALFNYVDDSLTSSTLAAALVNVEEYGKSNQLIIHNTEKFDEVDWEDDEATILLSELNYGSDITLTKDDLDKKQILNYDNRENESLALDADTYLKRAISAFSYCMQYNLSNGNYEGTYKSENPVDNVRSTGGFGNIKTIKHDDVLNKSFLGEYITTDIEVTRFDIYSIYRDRLANRHVYASPYMKYTIGSNSYTYDELMSNGDRQAILNKDTEIKVEWNSSDKDVPTWNNSFGAMQKQFDNLYKPCKYVLIDGFKREKDKEIKETDYKKDATGLKIENESYSSQLLNYNRKFDRFKKDVEYYKQNKDKVGADNHLVCYTDTQVSYQGLYNKNSDKKVGDGAGNITIQEGEQVERIPFHYFFVDSSGVSPENNSNKGLYGNNAKKCIVGEKAPIEFWSVYSYNGSNSTFTSHKKESVESLQPKISGGKMDGTEIENTSIYVEITFTVKTFPTMTGLGFNTNENTQEVTIGRLVDIELNTDYEKLSAEH